MSIRTAKERSVTLRCGGVLLPGDLTQPDQAGGVVLFAHGSGSSRHSPRNRFVASVLVDAGLTTLLFDLLEPAEDAQSRFDIPLLSRRLVGAIDWLEGQPDLAPLPLALFGASTGAAAALEAAALRPGQVRAVVSRGGRPDLAPGALAQVRCPTLLIVGSTDVEVLELNTWAAARLDHAPHRLEVVPGASHLFSEPGTLEQAAHLARDFLLRTLAVPRP